MNINTYTYTYNCTHINNAIFQFLLLINFYFTIKNKISLTLLFYSKFLKRLKFSIGLHLFNLFFILFETFT